jgi:2-polyprenyl-6-methoxyphenol hydroxylase-like FAD-dependent oxidoreductase
MTLTDCDVLIVGAGPTGLTLAAQLLARGVRTRLIDKYTGTTRLSRAVGTQPRTLEMLDTMGILDRFLDVGHIVHRVNLYSGKRRMLQIDHAYCGSHYPFELQLPQQLTEQLLLGRVHELGGVVETGTELTEFADDGHVVTATVQDESGRSRTISAGFLVGCDGAHSRVRKLLDLTFAGQPYPWEFWLADAEIDWHGRADEVHVFSRPNGLPLACIPITSRLWRLSLPMPEGVSSSGPTLDEIQQLVDQRSPWPIAVSTPETLTTFRCQIRSTSTYRRGRALLAGDAAHIQSPVGGQGMNTGMLDAANLSWKLALVVAGRATDSLLDTYGQERIPAAAQVLAFSDRMVGIATMRSWKRAMHRLAMPAYRLPAAQRRMAERLSQVSTRYRDGCLVHGGGDGRRPGSGARCPNIDVVTADGDNTLYGALRHGRHVLVIPAGMRAATLDTVGLSGYGDLIEVVWADATGWADFALVRPDAHFAAFGRRDEMSDIRAYLATYGSTATSYIGV